VVDTISHHIRKATTGAPVSGNRARLASNSHRSNRMREWGAGKKPKTSKYGYDTKGPGK